MERDFSLNASSFNLGWVGLGWVGLFLLLTRKMYSHISCGIKEIDCF